MTSPYDDAQQFIPYKPFPPGSIPTADQILGQLFPEPTDPPVEHYITPADLAYAWTAFLSMIDAFTGRIRTGPNPPTNPGSAMVPPARDGDMWVDTTLGDLWQYVGGTWRTVTRYGNPFTIAQGDPNHTQFPTASRDGDLHYDTLTGILWAHDLGTGWHAVSQGPASTPGVQALDDLLDVDTTGLRNGTALVYSAAQKQWVPVLMPKPTQFRGAVADAAALATITNPFDGDLAVTRDDGHLHVYIAASGWDNIGPVAASTVADGNDDGDMLLWDAGQRMWLPSADYFGDESNVFYAPGGDPANDHGVPIYNPGANEWNVGRLSLSDLAEMWGVTGVADGSLIVWDSATQAWQIGAPVAVPTLASLPDVDVSAAQQGDVLVLGAGGMWTTRWDKTPRQTPTVYSGTAALVPGDINDATKRYGMAADTRPDPLLHPPKAQDIYLCSVNDDVVRFTGMSAGHGTADALLAAIKAITDTITVPNVAAASGANPVTLGLNASEVNGNIVITQTGAAPALPQVMCDAVNGAGGRVTAGLVMRMTEAVGFPGVAPRTFTYTLVAGDELDGNVLAQHINAAFQAAPFNGDYTCRWFQSALTIEAARPVSLCDPAGNMWVRCQNITDRGGSGGVGASTELLATTCGVQDLTAGLLSNVPAPLSVTSAPGTLTLRVPADGSITSPTINLDVQRQHVNVTLRHTLGYYIEDRDNAAKDDALVFDGTLWKPEAVLTANSGYTKAQVDTKIASVASGITHGIPVRAITATPPTAPTAGDAYIVGVGATGAFAGQDGKVATWTNGAWTFQTPRTGEAHLNETDEAMYVAGAGSVWNKIGSVGLKVVVCTVAQYQALTPPDPSTLYLLT
jgi:hypothetical protein